MRFAVSVSCSETHFRGPCTMNKSLHRPLFPCAEGSWKMRLFTSRTAEASAGHIPMVRTCGRREALHYAVMPASQSRPHGNSVFGACGSTSLTPTNQLPFHSWCPCVKGRYQCSSLQASSCLAPRVEHRLHTRKIDSRVNPKRSGTRGAMLLTHKAPPTFCKKHPDKPRNFVHYSSYSPWMPSPDGNPDRGIDITRCDDACENCTSM